jgi:tetratricopeptide (TPR) repeat protein
MQLSTLSSSNITAAYEACRQWNEILIKDKSPLLDKNVLALCRALHASCFVRIGKDEEAVGAYDLALELQDCLDYKTNEDLILGKAQALQRLLKYSDAIDQYLQSRSEQGAVGAATCSLRMEDAQGAKEILTAFCKEDRSKTSAAVLGMLGTLQYLELGASGKVLPLLEGANDLPLYRWIYCVLSRRVLSTGIRQMDEDSFLELIKINLCPFDDASLVYLDDKVNLHELLTAVPKACSAFWPNGAVFPRDNLYLQELANDDRGSLWISKQRAGYGSHGNQILSNQQVLDKAVTNQEECLLQRMIEPTLLLDGRKFSLRIYVVYFSPGEVYLSSQGLVKLASVPMTDATANDPRMHMTNSGRESSMIQNDLEYLKTEFDQAGYSYGDFWSHVKSTVDEVFKRYGMKLASEERTSAWDSRRKEIGVPKIMGFDYVVDDNRKPWLVEVNRFPGLEPRDDSDREVKHHVVRDAWVCAGQRLEMMSHPMQDMLDKLHCKSASSSLERI